MTSPLTPRRRPARWLCALLLTAATPALADSMTGRYSVGDLGPMAPRGISRAGDIVLEDGSGWGFYPLAVRSGGKTTDLTPPPPDPGGPPPASLTTYSQPAISTGGTIVYNRYTSDFTTGAASGGVSLVAGGRTVDLGALVPPGVEPAGAFSTATAVNDRGDVVGSAVAGFSADPYAPPAPPVGFLSADRGVGRQTYSLGNLQPVAINNAGVVAGTTTIDMPTGATHAAIGGVRDGQPWQADLGTLGGLSSRANAINDAGVVVGASNIPDAQVVLPTLPDGYPSLTPDVIFHAFVAKDGKMVDLGTLPGDPIGYSEATGINAAGLIVGNTVWHPFLYRDGVMTDLNSLLPADSGWELTQALGINDAGQIIGLGYFNGPDSTDPLASAVLHGFVLDVEPVPEPASLVVFALAGAALVARRRFRRAG